MQQRLHRLAVGTLAALALFAGIVASSSALAAEPSPLIDSHFALTRLDGRPVTEADYRGKWLLVYFGYTFCPDICPTTLSDVGAALDALGPKADRFQPIFITLDPA